MTSSTSTGDTLVLVHGYLGYGETPAASFAGHPWGGALGAAMSSAMSSALGSAWTTPWLAPLAYFRGVAPALEADGHRVRAPGLPPRARALERAEALARFLADTTACPGERLHLIAHSMGGLDALLALHHHPEATARVRSVASLGTPFRGSAVADALLNPGPTLPTQLATLHHLSLLPLGDALTDLGTAAATALTLSAPLRLNVRWTTIAGHDARRQDANTVFKALGTLRQFNGQANDGLVARTSTRLPGAIEAPDWPVDHGQLAGWTLWFSALPPRLGPALGASTEHLARYRALAQSLVSG